MKLNHSLAFLFAFVTISSSPVYAGDTELASNLEYLNTPIAGQTTLAGAVIMQAGISSGSMGLLMRIYPPGGGVHTADSLSLSRTITKIGLAAVGTGAAMLIYEYFKVRSVANRAAPYELTQFFALPLEAQVARAEREPELAKVVNDLAAYLRAHQTKP